MEMVFSEDTKLEMVLKLENIDTMFFYVLDLSSAKNLHGIWTNPILILFFTPLLFILCMYLVRTYNHHFTKYCGIKVVVNYPDRIIMEKC